MKVFVVVIASIICLLALISLVGFIWVQVDRRWMGDDEDWLL